MQAFYAVCIGALAAVAGGGGGGAQGMIFSDAANSGYVVLFAEDF